MSEVTLRNKVLNIIIAVIAISMVIFQVISSRTMLTSPMQTTIAHGGLAVVLIFLNSLKSGSRKLWPLYLIMLALSIVSIGYMLWNYHGLIASKGWLTQTEMIIGVILVIVFVEATRQSFGKVVPIIAAFFALYVFAGQYLPYPFWHIKLPFNQVVAASGVNLVEGLFGGTALMLSANFIFLFVLFGMLLQTTGAVRFFIEIAKIPGRWLAGGPAMTAVVASALVGTSTGSGMANVAITGPFTIPLMKKVGYTAAQAGGIEAAASTGGSIMPPVMGIVAFVMAEVTGTPYIRLIAMAIIPAILYYLCIALFVHLQAGKLRVTRLKEKVDRKWLILGAPLFAIPIGVLLWLLVAGYSLRFTVFFMIASIVIVSLLRKETRGNLSHWIKNLTEGAILGAKIAVVLGVIGILMAFIDLTGLAMRFPLIVEQLSGGVLPLALLLVAIVTIILGAGVPPFAAYLLVAMLTAPVLIGMGVPFMQAHFFIYYYAVFALITPPVGLASLVAAPICGASYLKTSFEAVRAGVVAWFLPIMVIGAPVIILMPATGPIMWIPKLIACFAMLLFLQVALVGYYIKDANPLERAISGIGAAALIAFILNSNYILLAVGLAIGVFLTLGQLRAKRLLAISSSATN